MFSISKVINQSSQWWKYIFLYAALKLLSISIKALKEIFSNRTLSKTNKMKIQESGCLAQNCNDFQVPVPFAMNVQKTLQVKACTHWEWAKSEQHSTATILFWRQQWLSGSSVHYTTLWASQTPLRLNFHFEKSIHFTGTFNFSYDNSIEN